MARLNADPRDYGRSNGLLRRRAPRTLTRQRNEVRYAAGTGSAVTDLIFSIANREVTFFSGTAPISFL